MSIKIMSQVWEHSKHKGSPLLLLLAIADHADDDGHAYPGVERLAKKIRMTKRNTQIILTKLAKSGELEIQRNQGLTTKKGRTNLYHVNVKPRGENFSPHSAQGVKNSVEGVKNSAQGVKALSPKPSVLNHQLKTSERIFLSFKTELSLLIGVPVICRELVDTLKLIDFDAGRLILATTDRYREILKARHQKRIDTVVATLGLDEVILTNQT